MGVVKIKRVIMVLVTLLVLVGCGGKKEYQDNISRLADDVLSYSGEIESIVDKYNSVWEFSVENSSPVAIKDMAQHAGFSIWRVEEIFEINAAGNVPNDFSLNIHSLKDYYEKEGELEEIESNVANVKDRISDLNNPPKGYEKAFDEMLEMYEHLEKYSEMILDPSGSLQDFRENRREVESGIKSKYKRINVLIPND